MQLYKCLSCGYQFRRTSKASAKEVWKQYQEGKQTIHELAEKYHVSSSTIQRRLREDVVQWVQPDLKGMSGFVHLDATYWGHNWGVMLAIDETTCKPLYLNFIHNETHKDFLKAVSTIEQSGYVIRGLIMDGKKHLYADFKTYNLQMCQAHMKGIIKRYIPKNAKFRASRSLLALIETITYSSEEDFKKAYMRWKEQYASFINQRKSSTITGRTHYIHRRLRSAMHSIDYYLPFLFTYQREECKGMPNTNNKIEGVFMDLKRNLNTHSGLSIANRKRFISSYFATRLKNDLK